MPMPDGAPLETDFFKVSCVAKDNSTYVNIHAGIAYNATVHARSPEIPFPDSAMGYNVLMIGFDSVSRMTWLRKLPKTHAYITKELNGILLEGYNIVGDGTPQALLPILTGQTEEELPEARRSKAGAKPVDNHPWIWKEFQKLGYVTQWAEDESDIATFTYRMLGFKDQPVDHYMRPFYIVAEGMYRKFKRFCLGSVPRHVVYLNWVKDTFRMYTKKRKFMFGFISEYSHSDNNNLGLMDSDVNDFLHFLQDGGHLDHTILIMFGDHGARFDKIRETVQGKLEERMPYFVFRFPPEFEKRYSTALKNFRTNSLRLSTPFDIHETFKDILDFRNIEKGNISHRGISLFSEIPKERSCGMAGIEPHWCACLSWETVKYNDTDGKGAVTATVKFINSIIEPFKDKCAHLTLLNITRIIKYVTSNDMLKFKKSKDVDGRVADYQGKFCLQKLSTVTFKTTPGNGHFEATVRQNAEKTNYTISEHEISRINKYGTDPACIMETRPLIRPYCYCKSKLTNNGE
ncbi:LOW QUALITY PROTEIN: uncharacterized protein LOC135475699 [Liolophura sinensis]|uniref:LOW QUALITY PROTEIN: uncharacterized protein LOC135475699 n=1 Tax=Liolophura sinensis TaxID=3198878 RepID=UPI0031593876